MTNKDPKKEPIKSPYVPQPSPMSPSAPVEKAIDEAEIARIQQIVADIMRGAKGFMLISKELEKIDANHSRADGIITLNQTSKAVAFENVLLALGLSFEEVMIFMLSLQQAKAKRNPPTN